MAVSHCLSRVAPVAPEIPLTIPWGSPPRGFDSLLRHQPLNPAEQWGYTLPSERINVMTPILEVVHTDPSILGGTPVFVGTRVPAKSLFDYLEAGDTLDEFLRQFPSVKREQAIAAIELARDTVLARARTA